MLAAGRFGAGNHALSWDGRDDGGRAVAAGVYWARLRSGAIIATRKIVRLH
jgi:hypothetical protein